MRMQKGIIKDIELLLRLPDDGETEGEEIELPLIITFDYLPPDPGQLSGPPERCYPPEDEEYEITGITIDMKQVPDVILDLIETELKNLREIEQREAYGWEDDQ